MSNTVSVKNNERIPFSSIPEQDYRGFFSDNSLLLYLPHNHCVNYYGIQYRDDIKLIMCIADDKEHIINISSCWVNNKDEYISFTRIYPAMEKFEREIHENFGIKYIDHPCLKSVRYPEARYNKSSVIENYPFYTIDNPELHQVGVGPVHAGIIEPGHFRFICDGEQVLNLEIQLGYQHRGIEPLFLSKKKTLEKVILAESIAGDSVTAHTTAFSNLWEKLCGMEPSNSMQFSRTLAQETERMAMHIADLSAMCADVAYQLGSSVFGRLRTPIVNFFQEWCGNRLAKGLIRPGRINFPFTDNLKCRLLEVLNTIEPDFEEVGELLFHLPSALSRFEKTGLLPNDMAVKSGIVGVSARMSGLERDIRKSHPYGLYKNMLHEPVIKSHGDVYSRTKIRIQEVNQSMEYIRKWLESVPQPENTYGGSPLVAYPQNAEPGSFAISLVEGWRGEICHCAVTGADGDLLHYKIKDPSFHNWTALSIAVKDNEISDFPVCNKSFNLSYCGHDL